MQITTGDIHEAKKFAKALESVCDDILDGKTRTEALRQEGIGISVFNNLLKAIKRSGNSEDTSDIISLMHPAWQDELVFDITGDEYFYLPDDFKEALNDIEEKFLTEDETQVIDLLYPDRLSYEEVAQQMRLSVPTVRARRKSAIAKLKEHSGELFAGKELLDHLDEARKHQKAHQCTLSWMRDVLKYFKELGNDEDTPVADQPIAPEAISFYRRNGLELLSDVCRYSLTELFTDITDERMLAVVRESDDFSLDSVLDESIGLDKKSANAFSEAGIHTVREFLALSDDQMFSIKGIGAKTVVWIWKRVMFG